MICVWNCADQVWTDKGWYDSINAEKFVYFEKYIIGVENYDMLPSYRTMKYKSPIWGYFHVQKE